MCSAMYVNLSQPSHPHQIPETVSCISIISGKGFRKLYSTKEGWFYLHANAFSYGDTVYKELTSFTAAILSWPVSWVTCSVGEALERRNIYTHNCSAYTQFAKLQILTTDYATTPQLICQLSVENRKGKSRIKKLVSNEIQIVFKKSCIKWINYVIIM